MIGGIVMNKLVRSVREAVALSGVKDGMTVSFHHHLEKMSSADNGELLQGRDGRTHPFLSPSGK